MLGQRMRTTKANRYVVQKPQPCECCDGTGWERVYRGHGDFDEGSCSVCKGRQLRVRGFPRRSQAETYIEKHPGETYRIRDLREKV